MKCNSLSGNRDSSLLCHRFVSNAEMIINSSDVQFSASPPGGAAARGPVPLVDIRSARAAVRGETCAHVSWVVVVLVGRPRPLPSHWLWVLSDGRFF